MILACLFLDLSLCQKGTYIFTVLTTPWCFWCVVLLNENTNFHNKGFGNGMTQSRMYNAYYVYEAECVKVQIILFVPPAELEILG